MFRCDECKNKDDCVGVPYGCENYKANYKIVMPTTQEEWQRDCQIAYEKGREDAINNFVTNAITEFQKFDTEHGYPTLGDISVILSDVAEQLKEQNNGRI